MMAGKSNSACEGIEVAVRSFKRQGPFYGLQRRHYPLCAKCARATGGPGRARLTKKSASDLSPVTSPRGRDLRVRGSTGPQAAQSLKAGLPGQK